jgi:hypothetical protein
MYKAEFVTIDTDLNKEECDLYILKIVIQALKKSCIILRDYSSSRGTCIIFIHVL